MSISGGCRRVIYRCFSFSFRSHIIHHLVSFLAQLGYQVVGITAHAFARQHHEQQRHHSNHHHHHHHRHKAPGRIELQFRQNCTAAADEYQ